MKQTNAKEYIQRMGMFAYHDESKLFYTDGVSKMGGYIKRTRSFGDKAAGLEEYIFLSPRNTTPDQPSLFSYLGIDYAGV